MVRSIVFLLGLVWFGLAPWSVLAAGDCGWSPDKTIDGRDGERPAGSADFKFDSRVEKFSSTADKYFWCIENRHQYFVTVFRWGNKNNDQLYYSNFVEPRKAVPTSGTFSLGHLIDIRFLKFKHTYENETHWKTIEVETVFPKILGKINTPSNFGELNARASFQLAQLTQATPYDEYRYLNGQIDVERLSARRDLFDQFIAYEPIILNTSTIVTIPTSLDTLYSIEAGKYEKYQPSDFIRMSVSLENVIQLFNGTRTSDVSLSVFPEVKTSINLKRAAEAISNVRIYSELSAVERASFRLPIELSARKELKQDVQILYSQNAEKLVYADAVFKIASEKSAFPLTQVPVRFLFSPR